jgi:di/tricarboxylate transporter
LRNRASDRAARRACRRAIIDLAQIWPGRVTPLTGTGRAGGDAMIYVAAVIVIAALVAMASGRVSPVLALLVALIVAGILGIATPAQLFAGASNAGVITVAAMLVIAKGVVQTGLISRVSWSLLSGTTSPQQALRRLIPPVGVASSLMNTTPIVAMLIPATKELEQTRRIPVRPVLLPIAHVTTLAGSVTLIGTSSNLVIAGIAGQSGVHMSMLSFASVALPVALVGWLVLYLTAPHMLRGEAGEVDTHKEWRVEIPITANALARDRSAAQMGIATTPQFELTRINRAGEPLDPGTPVEADDVLVFAATETGVTALWQSPFFGMPPHRLFAATVKPGESGTLDDLEHDGSLQVIAARTRRPLSETELTPGDTCYVAGRSADALARCDAIALWQDTAGRAPQPGKTWLALAVLASVIAAASFGLTPAELAASAGAVVMVLTGVLTPGAAARALDLKLLFILAGSIGLGTIVVESGLADTISDAIRDASGGNLALVIVVFTLATAAITNLITNAATASILTPVAIGIARELHVDPVTVLALIGTCVSFTFINPFSHQSNLMVIRPGGYTTRAFATYGIPVLLSSVVSAGLVSYLLLR